MLKLIFVILHEKDQKVEVAVEKDGRRRLVTFVWRSKERTPLVGHWLQAVEAELNNQDAEALARAEGRQLMTGRRFPVASPKKPSRL